MRLHLAYQYYYSSICGHPLVPPTLHQSTPLCQIPRAPPGLRPSTSLPQQINLPPPVNSKLDLMQGRPIPTQSLHKTRVPLRVCGINTWYLRPITRAIPSTASHDINKGWVNRQPIRHWQELSPGCLISRDELRLVEMCLRPNGHVEVGWDENDLVWREGVELGNRVTPDDMVRTEFEDVVVR